MGKGKGGIEGLSVSAKSGVFKIILINISLRLAKPDARSSNKNKRKRVSRLKSRQAVLKAHKFCLFVEVWHFFTYILEVAQC